MSMKTLMLGSLALAVVPFTSIEANALVTNGGFETGNLSGWTCTSGPFNGTDRCETVLNSGSFPSHIGNYSLFAFDNIGFGTLSQTISTVSGQSYNLSFYSLTTRINAANILGVSIDGGAATNVVQTSSYALTIISFIASGSSTVLDFLFETDDGTGGWQIDDVSVESTTAVPVPAALPLLATGLGALGFAGWRRKRTAK
jgi:hypothetical protein